MLAIKVGQTFRLDSPIVRSCVRDYGPLTVLVRVVGEYETSYTPEASLNGAWCVQVLVITGTEEGILFAGNRYGLKPGERPSVWGSWLKPVERKRFGAWYREHFLHP